MSYPLLSWSDGLGLLFRKNLVEDAVGFKFYSICLLKMIDGPVMIGHPLSQVAHPFRVPTLHLLDQLQLLFDLVHLLRCQPLHLIQVNSAQVEHEFLVILDVASLRKKLAFFSSIVFLLVAMSWGLI